MLDQQQAQVACNTEYVKLCFIDINDRQKRNTVTKTMKDQKLQEEFNN